MAVLQVGARAAVRVPATSANLGPGFDGLGLAVSLGDELSVDVIPEGLEFVLSGEGVSQVPRDESHLVVTVIRSALAELGHEAPGLRLTAHNVIPHSRGLGSSAAAIVAGLALAWMLARPGEPLDLDWACQRSSDWEGHPDNACAAVLGGVVLAWTDAAGACHAVSIEPQWPLRAVAWVPDFELRTAAARQVLPESVPRGDAVSQAIHSALLVHALRAAPEHLLEATIDRLHQPYRAPLMQPSADLIASLREQGVAAVVSGAGPTVLAVGTEEQIAAADRVDQTGFRRLDLMLGRGVELVEG